MPKINTKGIIDSFQKSEKWFKEIKLISLEHIKNSISQHTENWQTFCETMFYAFVYLYQT